MAASGLLSAHLQQSPIGDTVLSDAEFFADVLRDAEYMLQIGVTLP